MTSWGNTRQRAAAFAALGLFIIAMLVADFSGAGALLLLFAGIICTAGVWALGLPKSTRPDDADWHAIK